MIDQIDAITTERLRLREPGHEDAAALAALANDFDVARMTTSMPFPYARRHADEFLERVAARDRSREAVFAIEHASEGPIGVLGFHPKDGPAPEIGYWIGRPYWSRGLATEAVRAALAWADGGWAKRFVVAGHFADNPASGRVLEKAGFLYTGIVRSLFSTARGAEAPTRMMVRLA